MAYTSKYGLLITLASACIMRVKEESIVFMEAPSGLDFHFALDNRWMAKMMMMLAGRGDLQFNDGQFPEVTLDCKHESL